MTKIPLSVRRQMQPGYAPNKRAAAAASGVTDEEVEKWRVLMNTDLTTKAEFLSMFKIPTDRTDTDETGYCYFDFYDFQQSLDDDMERMWGAKRRAEFRIPKSRRRGVSTFFLAIFFERMIRVPGWAGAVIAQTETDAKKHLVFLDQLQAQIPWEVLKRLGILKIRSSSKEIAIKHGRFKRSSVVVMTGSARGLGRGTGYNGILQTERPHWANRAKADRSAFLRTCKDAAGNIVVDESTACGYDEFYEDCEGSRLGQNPAQLVFLPSYEHDLNRSRMDKRDRERLRPKLGLDKKYGLGEEMQVLHRVMRWRVEDCDWEEEKAEKDALAFVAWRRYMIDGDCRHVSVFHREEPTTLEEAFSGAGRRVFPVDIMESWKSRARERTARGSRGRLVEVEQRGGPELMFVPAHDGILTVFEPPVEGHTYAFGSDVASGFETHRDGSTEADFNVMTVKDVFTGVTVAQIHGHIFPKPFARALLEVCAFYGGADNPARGYIETNLETVVALLLECDDLEVLGVTGPDVLLTSERKHKVRAGVQSVAEFGFKTTTKTKEYLISSYERFMVEWGEVFTGTDKDCPVDWETLSELLRFVRAPSAAGAISAGGQVRTTARAEAGHDDRTMAEMLASAARDELLTSGEVEMFSRLPRGPMTSDELMQRAMAEKRARLESKVAEAWYVPHPHGGHLPKIDVTQPEPEKDDVSSMWGF